MNRGTRHEAVLINEAFKRHQRLPDIDLAVTPGEVGSQRRPESVQLGKEIETVIIPSQLTNLSRYSLPGLS